jgi:Putative zinc-binding metallo-peptidase
MYRSGDNGMARQLVRFVEVLCLALSGICLLCIPNRCPAQSSSGKVTSPHSTTNSHELSQESRDVIAWAAKTYRIEIVWKNVPYPFVLAEERKTLQGSNPSLEAVEQTLPRLRQALAKYPRDLPHSVGLSRIILGSQLNASGVHIGGYSYPPSKSFILEIETRERQSFRSITLHHEIFHLIDKALLGQYAKQDVVWARLNGPNFKGYQSGNGWNWMSTQQSGNAKPAAERGFVSAYCMSSVQEDKAEVFAHLMEDPAALAQLAEKDPVIRAKVDRMKQMVRQANAKMDRKYFEKLAESAKNSER